MAKIKPLRNNPFFSEFSNKEIALFSRIVEENNYSVGTEIFSESSNSSGMYLVKKGEVEIIKVFEEIGPKVLSKIGVGELFGQLSLVDGGAHLVTARASTEVEALFISAEKFDEFNIEHSDATNKLLIALTKSLAIQLRNTVELFAAYIASRQEQ